MAGTVNINDLWMDWLLGNATYTAPKVNVLGSADPGTATDTADITVDNTAGGVTLLAAAADRRYAKIQNTGTANIRVTVDGTAPTATKGTQLAPGDVLELTTPDIPVTAIKAIREGSTNSTASVTQVVV